MSRNWDQARLQSYIDNQLEESLTLDYKAAGSLAKQEEKRKEITKDVSAFANSAGGTIIYGIREYSAEDKKHLPERIDPIVRTQYSKEWLEQIKKVNKHLDTISEIASLTGLRLSIPTLKNLQHIYNHSHELEKIDFLGGEAIDSSWRF